jgi:hypothetical protein
MREQDLYAEHLLPGESLAVRVRFTVDQPPCRTVSVDQAAKAYSDETAVTVSSGTTVRYTPLPSSLPDCGTPLSDLLAAIPYPARATCASWPGYESLAIARVACFPQHGVTFAVYTLYKASSTAQDRYKAVTAQDAPRSCGEYADGKGAYSGFAGNEQFQFTCSATVGGSAHLAWVDIARRVVGYANGDNADRDHLLEWYHAQG